jgi:metal-responsive CopG/Arc/MetJ family transcriptional regulator
MVKVTFTLDEDTVRTLRKVAERTKKPQSLVVREAVARYAAEGDKLSDDERKRKVAILRDLMTQLPTRPQAEVDAEIREIRRSRRTGWSRPSD